MKIYTIRKNGLPVWKIKLDIKGWILKLFKIKLENNIENIINVEMPAFFINRGNPLLISYNPSNTKEWRPILSAYYAHGELSKPKDDEIAYRYNGDNYRGFLLKK